MTDQVAAAIAEIARYANAGTWREALAHARALDQGSAASNHPDAKLVCAQVYLATGFVGEAKRAANEAVELAGDLPGPYLVRARAAATNGEGDAALADLDACISRAPASPDARLLKIEILHRLGRFEQVRQALDEARRAGFDTPEFARHRSVNAMAFGEITLAEAEARRAIEGAGDIAAAHQWLGTVLLQDGRVTEARSEFAAAIRLSPDDEKAWTDDLFAANYDPALSVGALKTLYVQWADKFAKPPDAPSMPAPSIGGRRLRVGYLSQDLRTHSIRQFLRPLLTNHDGGRVETFAYSATTEPDPETDRFKPLFSSWRDASNLDDAALAEKIRADGIDVLVDLAGHTAGSRLKVFSRKPAPVQATWLGYGGTTGVPEIDWYIGDSRMLPPGVEDAITEGPWRLPRPCFAYEPPASMPLPGPLPALRRGYVTFASFSRLVRINDDVVAAWSRILDRVPNSRLFLNALAFVDDGARKRMEARFAANGISADRLELRYTRPQPATWLAYRDVDIALDPFPHNGGVTSFEALWMGAPLVSKRDRPPLGRYGDCLLDALEMDDWCVDTVESYIERAVRAAADVSQLAEIRAGLRDRMRSSALCDGPGLARAMEVAFAEMRERASVSA